MTPTSILRDCESIQEFTRRIERGGMYNQPGLWHQRFRAAGYYSAEVGPDGLGLDPVWGWTVTWPGFEMAVADSSRKVGNLLEILFDELGLERAYLCVVLGNGEFDTFTINSTGYAQARRDYLTDYVAGQYRVSGVRFRQEQQARAFLEIMEKRLVWRRLGGTWTQSRQ